MLEGTTYQTASFAFTKIAGKVYRFSTPRCAESWKQRTVEHTPIPRPELALGFRSGTLLQDFRSGSLWYIEGSVRRPIDFDAWQKHKFDWSDVVVCSRRELELHVAKKELE